MLQALGAYIKLAVDVEQEILAGGGSLHADCEKVLLEHGSEQADVWGADWIPDKQQVAFKSLINIRPARGNSSMEIKDAQLRDRIAAVVRRLLEKDA